MTTVLIGCADQGISSELRALLREAPDIEVVFVAESTSEVVGAVLRLEPDVVVLHDRLGPGVVGDTMRELSLRRPGSALLVITSDDARETITTAMAAGARGALSYPFAFEEVATRFIDAGEWARTVQRLIGDQRGVDASAPSRAVVVAFTGAKGGVGATTLAVHLALDVVREIPSHKVLVLDLDLEKGDVGWLLDARHRISVADLAKVAEDLSLRTVQDAVFQHASGLHLLLTPLDVREVEDITPQAVRRIVSLLRQQYDLVVVDGGSHVTPVQAALIEIADDVVIVSTPDVLSLRSLRRALQTWEDLNVRKSSSVRVLLNKASRRDEVQPDTVRQLAQAPVVSVAMPAMFRKLEQAVNNRDPSLVREQAWWRALRAVGREVGVVKMPERQDLAAKLVTDGASPKRSRVGRGRKGESAPPPGVPVLSGDEGSIAVETIGILPVALLVVAFLWQSVLVGATVVYTGHAASAAARAATLGESREEVEASAMRRLPSSMRSDARVTRSGSSRVEVSVAVPLFAPGVLSGGWRIDVDRNVVREP